MKAGLTEALQAALEALARGEGLDAALAGLSYEEAAEIRSLLATASLLHSEDAPAGAADRSRSRFLRHAAGLRAATSPPAGGRRLVPRFALGGLAAFLALALGVGGLTEATARSLPGDLLYQVRLAAEDIRLQLASDSEQRLRLEAVYAEQRTEDVRRLLELGRVVPVSFDGKVLVIGPVVWDIDGIPVRRTPDTRVLGEILPGMLIEVQGITQPDGTVLADELHLESYDTVGTLESLDADQLTVGGVSLRITPQSVIDPGLVLGDRVLARIAIDDAGVRSLISALRFAPPTPTAAATTLATDVPTPSKTPDPTTEDNSGSSTETPEPDEDDDGAGTPGPDEDQDPLKLEFLGVVQSIGSSWVVDGRSFRVDGGTEIKDNPGIGDTVKVVAFLQPDGSWWAEKIELED